MSPSKLFPLLLIISQLFALSSACHPHDTKILLRIKHHLGNPPSLASWDVQSECCGQWTSWPGVKCNGQGHVYSLLFFGNTDIYTFPPFLDRLPALSSLAFSVMPNLTGPIPPYIGNLTGLSSFMIYMSNVSGPIPSFLGQLTNLNDLYLGSNKFTGPIPDYLGRLTSLTELDLSENSLNGPIPSSLGNLTKLQRLDLNSNNLSGPIPYSLGAGPLDLASLDMHLNNLTGPLPESLGFFRSLTFMSLSQNQITGPIPKTMAQARITIIGLSENQLSGDASFLFDKNNTASVTINLKNNQLKFDFTNVDLSPRLYNFDVSNNQIYGRVPKLLYRMKDNMENRVNLAYNNLCGPIPNGRRLKQVNPIIFDHNKCLCGGPLPACK